MSDSEVSTFSLVDYIRERAVAAGMDAAGVEREVAWAVQYAAETPEERTERCRRDAMRDHPFEGDGPYCTGWSGPRVAGSVDTGLIVMRVGCGWSRDMHPEGDG